MSHRVALDATAEEGDDDGCEGSDGIGKAVRRITGLPLSFESMVSNWKWRPNRLSYKDMAGTVEDAEDDDAEDVGDDSAGISNALGGGVGLLLARPAS